MRTVRSYCRVALLFTLIGCQQGVETPMPAEARSVDLIAEKLVSDPASSSDVEKAKQPPSNQNSVIEEAAIDSPDPSLSIASDQNSADKDPTDQPAVDGPSTAHGPGTVHGPGRVMGRGFQGGRDRRADMTTIHAMFSSREKISRTVKTLPNGAQAVTESDDKAIAELIQEHVPAVESRVLENKPLPPMTFHPIFTELMKHSEDYSLTYDETEKGIKVTYTATDPYVVMLVQEHAKLVSRFLKNGMSEIHKQYKFPSLKHSEAKSQD